MHRRIVGLETEYGIYAWRDGRRFSTTDDLARLMYRNVRPGQTGSDTYLVNGARLYLDIGSHPEYATAECDDLLQLIAHDKAGERILEDLTVQLEKYLRKEGTPADVFLFRNNTDSYGTTYGCHENYLVERSADMGALARGLLPFFVTRQLIVGSGKVIAPRLGGEPRFTLSQRAPHMLQEVSTETTRYRTIFNTRDEPLADQTEYRRLHVIVGDSNMSETTTLLKVGATDLVLRLLRSGVPVPQLELMAPVRAIGEINRDITGRTEVQIRGAAPMTALEIQQAYYSAVHAEAERRGWLRTEPVTARVLELWQRTLTAIERSDRSLIDRDIDWAIKLALLERYTSKHGLGLDAPRVAQIDLAYHDTRRSRGLYYRLEERGMVTRVVTTREVLRATHLPPQTTRAKLRGDFIRTALRKRHQYTGSWTELKVREGSLPSAKCLDPWATRSAAVDDLCQRL